MPMSAENNIAVGVLTLAALIIVLIVDIWPKPLLKVRPWVMALAVAIEALLLISLSL
jgi:hypothetical protein